MGDGFFVYEIGIATTEGDEVHLNKTLKAVQRVYNDCLEEGLKRVQLLRESRSFRKACREPDEKKRKALFQVAHTDLEKNHQVTILVSPGPRGQLARAERVRKRVPRRLQGQRPLADWVCRYSSRWESQYLCSQAVRLLGDRAGKVIQDHLYRGTKVRFRRLDDVVSFSTPNVRQGIRWKKLVDPSARGSRRYETAELLGEGDTLLYLGREYRVLPIPTDAYGEHAAGCEVHSVRIIRRPIRGRYRFFAQFTLRGEAYVRPERREVSGGGAVGLDLGPSTVAVVWDEGAELLELCAGLDRMEAKRRRLRRKIALKERVNHPELYGEDRVTRDPVRCRRRKKGVRLRGRARLSKAEWRLRMRLRSLERAVASARKAMHGQLVNRIVQRGSVFHMEDLNYRTWQKRWGRAVKRYAPGFFVSHLRLRVEQRGGTFVSISTLSSKLSQTCHGCGQVVKKPLSQRWHRCECGVEAQRDLYSAFLARHAGSGTVDYEAASADWIAVQEHAAEAVKVAASSGNTPWAFGIGRGRKEVTDVAEDG